MHKHIVFSRSILRQKYQFFKNNRPKVEMIRRSGEETFSLEFVRFMRLMHCVPAAVGGVHCRCSYSLHIGVEQRSPVSISDAARRSCNICTDDSHIQI